MSETGLKILSPGFFTTIQDLGRFGYQQFGVPQSGAMDGFSLKLANLLVGNKEAEAGLEITYLGPEIEFDGEFTIAIAGADMSATLNGKGVALNSPKVVKKGDILKFGTLKSGSRVYVAIRGGISVPEVMGSKSTYVKAAIGGLNGRGLKAGDWLGVGNAAPSKPYSGDVSFPVHKVKKVYEIGILPGPEVNNFTQAAIRNFLVTTYTVAPDADRMGYRLEGAFLEKKESMEILSSGIALGTIQVPSNGKPIILMADRQTTGGYPRIANVISADISTLAQLKPGDKILFKEVTMDFAVKKLHDKARLLQQIKDVQ